MESFKLNKTSKSPLQKKYLLTLLSLFPLLVQGELSGIYIDGGAGFALSDTLETQKINFVYDQGPLLSLSLGYQYNHFRLELQERYKRDKLYSASAQDSYNVAVDGDSTINSQMLNFYYNGYNESKLMSSIGFGLGVSSLNTRDIYKNCYLPSAQGLFSIGYRVSDNFISSLNYAYFYTLKSDDYKAKGDNSFTFSLRYIF